MTDANNAVATRQFSIRITGGSPVSITSAGVVNATSYAGGAVSPGRDHHDLRFGSGTGDIAGLELDSRGYVSNLLEARRCFSMASLRL